MKKFVAILLALELFLAYFVLAPTCIYRVELVHAITAWRDDPTAETQAELDRQRSITAMYELGFSTLVFAGMAGVTLLAVYAWRQRQIRLRQTAPSI